MRVDQVKRDDLEGSVVQVDREGHISDLVADGMLIGLRDGSC